MTAPILTATDLSLDAGVRVAGFEPTLSCSRSRRTTRLSHTLKMKRPAAGASERACQGGRRAQCGSLSQQRLPRPAFILPNRSAADLATRTSAMARQQATATSWARRIAGRIVKDESTGPPSTAVPGHEPTSPPTNLRSVPGVRSPRRRPPLRGGARTSAFPSMGSEGLEPSVMLQLPPCARATPRGPCSVAG